MPAGFLATGQIIENEFCKIFVYFCLHIINIVVWHYCAVSMFSLTSKSIHKSVRSNMCKLSGTYFRFSFCLFWLILQTKRSWGWVMGKDAKQFFGQTSLQISVKVRPRPQLSCLRPNIVQTFKKKVYIDNGCLDIITRNHVSQTNANIVAYLYNIPVSRIGYM